MFVRDWMTKNPKTVPSKTPVMEAMQILREGGYRRLPVVDNGKLVGIATDKDLKEATPSKATTLSVYELNYLLSKLTIKDVMKTPIYSVSADDPVEKAALLMEEKKISGLTVVDTSDSNKVVGIVTITDILHAFANALGLREGGTRFTIRVPDEPGVLVKVAAAAPPANIVAVALSSKSDKKREIVLRVTGENTPAFAERLKQVGVEVVDIQ
ncbi:MAG: CBS and ACT domain-containing protein [Trueperaceae bacterium]